MRERLQKDVPMFKEPLEKHREVRSFNLNKLKQVGENKDYVIRETSFKQLEHLVGKEVARLEDAVKVLNKIFDDVRKYGIRVPVNFVIGKNEKGETVIYSIVDKIQKTDLDFGSISENEKKKEAQEHFEIIQGLAQYLKDKVDANETYLSDIFHDSQYVYGKRRGEKENHLYLVDVDMWSNTPRDKRASYFVVKDFRDHIIELGVKYGKYKNFDGLLDILANLKT